MIWERRTEGLIAETKSYRLLVQLAADRPRFLILRRPKEPEARPVLVIASGSAETVAAAMAMSSRMVARMEDVRAMLGTRSACDRIPANAEGSR